MNDKIKTARIAARLTQRQLADKAGITKQAVSNIECGRNLPTVGTLQKLGAAMGVDWRKLV